MSERTRRGRVVRWGVPIATIAVVAGAIGAGPVIAAVQGEPALPQRTAQQLLADATRAAESGLKPMSGTVMQTASLGLPALPGMAGASPAALLAGSHELKVWYGGADRVRFALPGRMSETDLIINGGQVWLWDSQAHKATRIKGAPTEDPAGARLTRDHTAALPSATTPQQLAEEALKRADADTVVSVSNTERVADRPAYQLVLAPKDGSSLVKEIRLALDGETLIPLRVQIYAKSAAEPAFEVGFTSVTFTPPAEDNFAFTPPAGAKVEEKSLTDLGRDPQAGQERAEELKSEVKTVGKGWTTVAILPFSLDDLKDQARSQPEGRPAGQDATAITDTLLKAAKPVSGTWGSGRVIQTKLVSALLTDDGRLLVGAVTPDKLTEAAGQG
ncbi:LolA family protein [Streptosporangium sp. CA-135522]|uniref:LolA family protein n=1 Tax=Streptosporangium sp. CA-135522 TaxID=3240072 RepID=UPI003D930E4B